MKSKGLVELCCCVGQKGFKGHLESEELDEIIAWNIQNTFYLERSSFEEIFSSLYLSLIFFSTFS